MNIHEYQAKELLKKYGVKVLKGKVAFSNDEAVLAAKEIGGDVWVVKAQIHAGGRGKGGGVKIAKSIEEVNDFSKNMIGMNLVTHQTGKVGKKVKRLYIEEGCDIKKELYIGVVLDRKTGRFTFMSSTEGGTEIEKVAEKNPEKIFHVAIDPALGLMPYQARQIAFSLGIKGNSIKLATKFILSLEKLVYETDASLVEINPLVETTDGEIIALDAKINFDDNALFRQSQIESMRDESEEEERELKASKFDLNYIKLDGDIGCMVNGAGLAMATMDIIKLKGSSPANFLDVGGGATGDRVKEAFKIIISDPDVNAILVNIFGGIMRCDIIAQGIIDAAKEINLKVPLVVRLEGTNVDLGKKILASSDVNIISASDLEDAAEKVVNLV